MKDYQISKIIIALYSQAFGQFSGHNHTFLKNMYLRNVHVIMSKCYIKSCKILTISNKMQKILKK